MKSVVTWEKTKAAVAAYDAHEATVDAIKTNDEFLVWSAEEQRLGRAVGRAYGEETGHINNVKTCEDLVRPGPWLRGMIAVPLIVEHDTTDGGQNESGQQSTQA